MALTGGAGLAAAESGAEARGNGCLAELGRGAAASRELGRRGAGPAGQLGRRGKDGQQAELRKGKGGKNISSIFFQINFSNDF